MILARHNLENFLTLILLCFKLYSEVPLSCLKKRRIYFLNCHYKEHSELISMETISKIIQSLSTLVQQLSAMFASRISES